MHHHLQLIQELHAPQLPYELWEQILLQLPRSDQRSCLGVCKIAHDVALPLVFSRITVLFGCWQSANDPIVLEHSTWSQNDVDAHQQNMITIDLLRHIVQEPEFARLVKEMSVAAFAYAAPEETERTSLVEALRHLNLSSFFYYGTRPALDTEIMDALVAGSDPTLRELRVPCNLFRDDPPQSYCFPQARFPLLETIVYVGIDNAHSTDRRRRAPMECVTESAIPPSRLCIPKWGPCGPWLETSLRELELTNLAGCTENLKPILAFTQLRSLTLVGAQAYHLCALYEDPALFPLLNAFKLVPKTNSMVMHWLCSQFLMEKKHLTRLDVKYSYKMLEAISHALASVEVLGVDVPLLEPELEMDETAAARVFDSLDAHLPRNLSALLIYHASARDRATDDRWSNLVLLQIRKRPGLRYIHFIGPGPSSTADGDDDHLQRLCDNASPTSLELVGVNSRMHWVLPSGSFEGAARTHVLSEPWSLSKVWLRRPGDFGRGNEGWEWLLRHHDQAMLG